MAVVTVGVTVVEAHSRKANLLLLLLGLVLAALLRTAESSFCVQQQLTTISSAQQYHRRHSFIPPRQRQSRTSSTTTTRTTTTNLFMNMFGDMLNKAFANDSSLSRDDKVTGQLEGPGDDADENKASSTTLTETQHKWRQQMLSSTTVTQDDLIHHSIQLDLYLTGIPNKDPSNDLFGSRVNISLRDQQVGLLPLPTKPTVSGVQLEFLSNGKCRIVAPGDNSFIDDVQEQLGDWILSQDNNDTNNNDGSSQQQQQQPQMIRFRVAVTGYTRRVETKGTIQKVYWSKEEEKTTATSTTYSIPAGWLYGEATLSKRRSRNNRPVVQWGDVGQEENGGGGGGVLKVEQSMGLLGVASKMTPCGKFTVQMIDDSQSVE